MSAPAQEHFPTRPAADLPTAWGGAFSHLYIHLPFCKHKCGYCDFNAYAGMDRLMPDYVDALERELAAAREQREFARLQTVYLGGGTPSLLPADLIARLLAFIRGTFDVATDAEVTLEANPASTDAARITAWLEGGVNRLSLGVQGFEPRALAVLERKTDAAQATRAFELARSMGVSNISIDLIYAVPHQSLESWVETLKRGLALGPDHVSTYCLTFEEGTLLFRRRAEGKVPELDPDLQWDQLDAACAELDGAGFRRYEVSNWARPRYESRHNLAYWRCRPVYGAGAGAHSYTTDGSRAWRSWNVARPRDYIAASPAPRADGEELSERKAGAEALMLGLRTAEGIVVPGGFEAELRELASAGLIERVDGRVAPTRRGMDLHNQIALAVL
ncbi:MAG TPA: radical SAM family heme chaperone HemW [Candidatus Dormibacteraeota bacterium]|nr:radical SAM family heme chaperone HemW [Candidatus Dormibacteraeota bacterium]